MVKRPYEIENPSKIAYIYDVFRFFRIRCTFIFQDSKIINVEKGENKCQRKFSN